MDMCLRANELMVGDWLQYYDCNLEKQCYAQVTSIQADGVESFIQTSDSDVYYLAEEYKPIPLTAEILERNRFGKVLDEYGMECYHYFNNAGDGYIKICLYDGGACDWIVEIVNYDKFNDNEIVYKNSCVFLKVHELQHALKLCGIDKEIEL